MGDITRKIFLDFETRSKCEIEHGAARYAADPSTDLLLTAYAIEDGEPISTDARDPTSIELRPMFEAIEDGYDIVAHNMLFEVFIWKYVCSRYKWPKTKISQWIDTMHLAGRAGLPMNLEGACEALRVTHKLSTGKELIFFFSIPRSDGSFNEMNDHPEKKLRFMEYNIGDVVSSRDLYVNLPDFKPHERDDIVLDLRANLYGVRVDVETSARIYNTVLAEQARFAERAQELTGGIIERMTQTKRIKDWVNNSLSERTELRLEDCTADTVEDWLENKSHLLDDVSKELLEMRRHSGKSSTGKYYRYINSTVDEIVYGMIISFGAHTHRTISKLLNLNNLPKPSIKYETMDELVEDLKRLEAEDIVAKYGSYLKAASTAIRGMIIPRENHVLAVADYNAIEARLVFWLAGCMAGIKKYESDVDLYKDLATIIFSVPLSQVTDDQRWVGKNCILGAGFGLGWKGFQNTCLNYGREIPEELCKTTIYGYRELYPEVPDAWNQMHEASMEACLTGQVTYALNKMVAFKTFRTKSGVTFLLMRKPSGSFMMYPDIKLVMTTTPWGSRQQVISYKKVINNAWVRETTYGGSLYENVIQSVARDIMYNGAKRTQVAGYNMLFAVYDEMIAEILEEKADIAQFQSALCELPDWATGLPLKAGGKLLKHYQKI